MSARSKILMVLLLGVLVWGFSYLRVLGRRIFFESRPHTEEGVRTRLNQAAMQSASGASQTVTLYFLSFDHKQLVSEQRQIAWAANDVDRIRQVVLALIEGSHQGRRAALPPSAEVRAVFLAADGTAYLDFPSDAPAGFPPGIASETLSVYALVNSVAANVPAVKRVRILIQGQEVETLDGHADLSDYYISDPALNAPGA